MITIARRYRIEAAHRLTGMREGHKCSRLHGHNYEITLVAACSQLGNGMVVDAEVLDRLFAPVLAKLDHQLLNEAAPDDILFGAMREQPTAENIAICLWHRIATMVGSSRQVPAGEEAAGVRLIAVRVRENEDLEAEYAVP